MTKTNTRNRIVSILLVLVMLLTMVPINAVTASAATTGDGTKGNPFVVTTYEDWKEKMELPGEKYITLGADIDTSTMNGGFGLGSTEFVSAIGRSHLDLNGKKLTLKKSVIESGGAIQFICLTAGEMIIEDSQGGGEIFGVNKVTRRYMRLIDVFDGAKLTMNSGKLHLEVNAEAGLSNATIESTGTVEINGGTVAISCPNTWDERGSNLYNQDYALSSSGKAVINGGTLDGRVLLAVVAKASGVADNVITGGDFKKSIYIHKDKDVTGDVPLNVSIQGGTYHYTPGYYTFPNSDPFNAGKKSSDPFNLMQFATFGFRDGIVYQDGAVYSAFPSESSYLNYDMNAFASMFPKNAIITAEGQTYDFYDTRKDAPTSITVSDAAFTGSSSALDLARLVNSHYKTITVTTLPEDALKDMKLTVGDGTPLPAQGNSTVSGDVTLGSDGTLTKNVYITALGNKQLKEMYYSNPSKIDFGYRLNIFKDGVRVTDYTGDSLTYAALGDEISVSVQLPNFKFEEGVYTFRLGLYSYLRGSEAQIGETLVGLWKLTAKEEVDLPIDSVTLDVPKLKEGAASGADFTLSGTNTGVSTINTAWEGIPSSGAVAGNFYAARITLTAKDGYAFNTKTQVNLNGDYVSKGSGIDNGGKGMIVYVNVPVRHEHTYGAWQIAGNGNVHFRKCSCGVQEEKPHEWKYLEGQDKYKCTVCGYEIDGEKERITYVYASPRSPIAGEHPGDYTPAEWVKISGANYKVESIVWKNMDDTDVTTFESGKIYKGTVTFKADTGFAFDGDRIYASQIFNSSNAEVVGNYTLTDGGTTLTATFKLKDVNVVKPGLKAKVKLPTLNDKIGQSLPAAELVDITLPENVALVYSVYEDNLLGEAITDPDYKVKSNQKYVYTVWLKYGDSTDITEITKTYNVSYEVTDGGDTETYTDLVGYGVLAIYQTPDTSKINSVALTVTAPKYGEAPATTATATNDTRYTVGTPTWSPAVTDGKFGAAAYTVSIPVTAAEGYSFDANCVYTVNGYVATYADGKVSYTFPALTAPHKHSYGTWTMLDDSQHSRSCTCGDMQFETHTFSAWTKVDESTHSRTCSKCKKSGEATNYTETAEHTWAWVVDQEAALNQPGKQHEECTGCYAKRSENTEIPALRDYTVTVTGGTATVAAGTPITRAMEGVEVTVTAQAPAGTHFVKWVVKAGGVTLANETSATTTFIMPANDVTIEAEFAENPVEAYTLTVIKGTASVAAGTPITDKIAQNTVVTVTADAPETGKVFDKWDVLEGNVTLADATKATTTFTMPASAVKIEATYKDAPPSHPHSYGTDWKYDDTNHWHECECGDKADVAAHSYVWKTDKEATKFKDGSKHEECSVCGAVRNAGTIIPATLGHCWIIDFIISVKDFVIGATKGTVEFIISAFKQIIGK